MIVDLNKFGPLAKDIEAEFLAGDIDLGDDITIDGKTVINASISRDRDASTLTGRINADVIAECVRCLSKVRLPVDIDFTDVFMAEARDDAELQLEYDELDASLIAEDEIDLGEIVREQILLALPEMVFCREDCEGLCIKCGANLNLKDCGCDEVIDPRWSALKNLK